MLAQTGDMQRRAIRLVFAVAVLALSCSHDPDIEERAIVVYSPRACPVSETQAYSVIHATGDFEPSIETPPTAAVFLRDVGRALPELPKETRSVVVDIAQGERHWHGLSDVPNRGPINVLVWPEGESCRLTRDVERRSDMALGVFGRHFIVAGGRSLDGSQVPHTYVGDLSTGAIERLAFGLNTRRANPSITEFRSPSDGDGPAPALVAGGHDPDSGMGADPFRAIASAEIYVPKAGAPNNVGDFARERIELSEPRTRHGAVVLSTGETLLVGGSGPAGPLRTMEIVDPVTKRARTAGVALLNVPRENPTVLRLANGEVLVAGGLDAHKNPVGTLEWFAPDASHPTKPAIDLVTGQESSFVALEAGGALAVIRPEPGASRDFKTVWAITADGTLEPALPIDPTTLDTVRLFPGSEGAPALWTGRRWMRWSPWLARFETIADAPDRGPAIHVIANGDPGLALWLDDRNEAGMNVTGFRFATQSQFGPVPKPLLVSGTEHLAPDRLAGISGSSIAFEPTLGLVLGTGASAFLTDFTFADFELQLDIAEAAPIIVLRPELGTELEIGGASCAFSQVPRRLIEVKRRGQRLTVAVDEASERACAAPLDPKVRVALGLRGSEGAGVTAARNLRVTRR